MAVLLACAVPLVGAGPAVAADGVAIAVTTDSGQLDPMAFAPRVFTVSGTSTVSTRLYVKYRAADGTACGTVPISEPGRWLTGFAGDSVVTGPFSLQRVVTWDAAGPYMFCSWLAPSDQSIVAPIAQTISFRPPTGAIDLARVRPAVPRPDQYFTLTLSGTTEAPGRVYAKIRPAGGAPCASRLTAVDCRNDHKLARISVRTRLTAICARYGFSVEPRNGSRVTVAFVMPSGRRYSSVGMVWKDGARAATARWLKAGAFKRRPGRWRMVLRVNGTPVRSTSFRVY